jgi:outer membrane beta-barrel protein
MNAKALRSLCIVLTVLTAQAAFGQELIEKVVVRNRLYSMAGKPEAGIDVGLTLLSRLTDHINLNAHFAYNITDTFALEVRAGYALSRHTGLANQIAEHFAVNTSIKTAFDLADLWEMNGNAVLGIRWAPVYGKISLMAELPVHFQAYLWLGAGAAQFHRESIVYCTQGSGTNCNAFFTEDKIGPMGTVALGARFFVSPKHSIKLELRDYSYPDSYFDNINRTEAMAGRPDGATPNKSPGISNLAMIDIGYSFIF